ncbi:MAG: hypothetical protein KAR42_12380 [candidate division Zixibacteria bacterium]|nr:hypothetical protein [candidate division Zixibacteria bacterium]
MDFAKIIKTIIKYIGMGLLFLFILEIASRTDDYVKWDAPFWSNYSNDNLSVSDEYGWHNRPNATFQKWVINSHGFRGPEITFEKPDSIIRVFCTGASATFGLYESKDKDYPSQLRKMLNKKYPGRFEVLNAACPGMSPPRIGHYYSGWLSKFSPDIIAYNPASDFYTNPYPPSDTNITRTQPSQPPLTFRLTSKAKIAFKGFLPRSWQMTYKRWQIANIVDSQEDDWLWETPPLDRMELYRKHIIGVIDTVRAQGSKIIIGTKTNSISSEMNDFDKYNLTNWRHLHVRCTDISLLQTDIVARKIILEIGKEYNVPIADIAPNIPKTHEYFGDHHHFTDKGAKIVAKFMFEQIVKIIENDSLLYSRAINSGEGKKQ